MNLINFDKYISSTIVKRGKSYFRDGHVEELSQLTNSDWEAVVCGTDDYKVLVKLSPEDEILSSKCDCPYDGPYCKHEVAVFYALQKEPKKTFNTSPLETILNEQTKEVLVRFILDQAKEHPHFQQKVLSTFVKKVEPVQDPLKAAEKKIMRPMKNALRVGYISNDDVDFVLSGAEEVMDEVQDFIDFEDFLLACELSLLCYSKTLDLYEISDGGLLDDMLENCLDYLNDAILGGISVWEVEEQEYIFRKILDVSLHIPAPFWQLELLHYGIPFCEDPAFSTEFCNFVAKLTFESESKQQKAEALILHGLLISYDQDKIDSYIETHPDNPEIRKTRIEFSLEEEDYEGALKLASEGIDQDFGKVNLRSQWEKYAYDAHKSLGNKEAMRGIAFMRAAEGDLHFYEELRTLYHGEEWKKIIKELIEAFDEMPRLPFWYPDILIEEKEYARLLEYCKKDAKQIYKYSEYLTKNYREEVKSLFYQDISLQANASSNRSHYQGLRNSLQQFLHAGYKSEVKDIIEQLKIKYPRRTAMHDELRKVR